MKRYCIPLVLAGILLGCQTQRTSQAYEQYAKAELTLLQYASNHAASASVYTKSKSPLPDAPAQEHLHPMPEAELTKLKEIISRASIAPFLGDIPLKQWKNADIGIRLHGIAGELIFDLNEHTLNSFSEGEAGCLICLTSIDKHLLESLPSYESAKILKKQDDAYAEHCANRRNAPERLLENLRATTSMRLSIERADAPAELHPIGEEESAQIRRILSYAQALPSMNRSAWDSPENHAMPVPPLQVFSYLELLDANERVLCNIPLDYNYIAKESDAESFRLHEKEDEQIALPDEEHTSFHALPFWNKRQEHTAAQGE